MTEQELQALCSLWQKRLRLQDWTVVVRVVRRHEMALKDVQGECEWVLPRKQAVIRLLDPVDYVPERIVPQDMETDLVHELLHLYFAPFDADDGTLEEMHQEQAINAIGQALVALARKGADDHGEDAG